MHPLLPWSTRVTHLILIYFISSHSQSHASDYQRMIEPFQQLSIYILQSTSIEFLKAPGNKRNVWFLELFASHCSFQEELFSFEKIVEPADEALYIIHFRINSAIAPCGGPDLLAQFVAWLFHWLGGTGFESRLGWPFIFNSSCHLILVCVNYDLYGSLHINSRLHARLNNQLSHPILNCW